MLTIPDYINKYLLEKNLYQNAFAKLVPMHPSNLQLILAGKRRCGYKLAIRIANTLKLDGKEQIIFLNMVRTPSWKVTQNNEDILYNTLFNRLKLKGIAVDSVKAVVPTKKETYLIQKDGSIYELELSLKIKE